MDRPQNVSEGRDEKGFGQNGQEKEQKNQPQAKSCYLFKGSHAEASVANLFFIG